MCVPECERSEDIRAQLAKTTEQFSVSVTSLNNKLKEPKDKTGELLVKLIDEQTKLIQSIMESQEEQMKVITSEIINLSNKQTQVFVAFVVLFFIAFGVIFLLMGV